MPRSAPGPWIGFPSSSISPPLGSSRPATSRASVDFPQPEGPITQVSSRLCTWKETRSQRLRRRAARRREALADRSRTSRMTGRCFSFGEARAHLGGLLEKVRRRPVHARATPSGAATSPSPAGIDTGAGARPAAPHHPGHRREPAPPRRPQPGEQLAAQRREHDVGDQADEADQDDRREHPLVVPVLRLLVDEVRDAGADADQLGDDQVRPRPAEQHAHVRVDLGDDAGNDDARDQHAPRRAQRLGRFEQGGIDPARRVGDDQNLLEEGADEDDRDLGRVLDAQDRDGESAERGRRQIAEELDERLGHADPSPAARRT